MSEKNVCLKQKVFCVQVQAASDKCKSVLSRGFLVIKVAVKCVECVLFTRWLQTPLWPIVLCRHKCASSTLCHNVCLFWVRALSNLRPGCSICVKFGQDI